MIGGNKALGLLVETLLIKEEAYLSLLKKVRGAKGVEDGEDERRRGMVMRGRESMRGIQSNMWCLVESSCKSCRYF